jgi:hypothetical protein
MAAACPIFCSALMSANDLAAVCFEVWKATDLEIMAVATAIEIGSSSVWELV